MAHIFELKTYQDSRGSLNVVDKNIPFEIKRIFYIYSANGVRGGHRHHTTWQALICVAGSCEIYNHNGEKEESFLLDTPSKCLVLKPQDWHTMHSFSTDAVLLVLASTHYDANDYIDTPYAK